MKMVKMLLENGADKNKVSNIGYIALAYAWSSNNSEVMKLLIDNGNGLKGENQTIALIYAAANNLKMKPVVSQLINKVADLNAYGSG